MGEIIPLRPRVGAPVVCLDAFDPALFDCGSVSGDRPEDKAEQERFKKEGPAHGVDL